MQLAVAITMLTHACDSRTVQNQEISVSDPVPAPGGMIMIMIKVPVKAQPVYRISTETIVQ